ncbi:MAG: aspartate aminotransferase family protein [Thaumarchaeota archaeon]|nr:aspartate aminotransferase family protein [Nitrososphaerota archaeon]
MQLDEDRIVKGFESRTPKSAEMFQKALKVTPGGVMAGIKFFEPYPVFMKRASGSRIWDVDDNDYVDYLMSYGALILGHGDSSVKKSIASVLESFGTTVTGTPTEVEVDYGAVLRDLYHKDGLIRFTNSGLEATLLAVRLAKGHTGRRKVAKFEGHYHGAVDRLLFSYAPAVGGAGTAESPVPIGDSMDVDLGIISDSVVLPFNDWKSTEQILTRNAKELACLILEPFEEGVIAGDAEFMRNLRKITRDLRIPLIYDEVKTGFRVRPGGASEFYSITPDLTCLGKIIGGGLPIGAVVGDADIMNQLDPRGKSGTRIFHSGTFNGNPLSLSVGKATVEEIMRRGRFDGLRSRTENLKRRLSAKLTEYQVPHVLAGEGAMFNFYMTDKPVKNYRDAKRSDLRLRRFLDIELISRGVYLKPENRYCTSLAHSDADLSLTETRFAESLDSLMPNVRR